MKKKFYAICLFLCIGFLNIGSAQEVDSIYLLRSSSFSVYYHLFFEKRIEVTSDSSYYWLWVLGAVSLTSLSLFVFYFRRQRFYKRRFEEILNTEPDKKLLNSGQKINELDRKVVENIRSSLKSFERNKEFLDGSLTLNSLSKKLDTNSNYLSKVINFYKQKNFSNYLNDLRIEYAVNQLKSNVQFRMYSVKGMASEVGFNNATSFSKAFYKRTGLYPSYFLKQLERNVVS